MEPVGSIEGRSLPDRRRDVASLLAAAGYFLLLAVALTWPLASVAGRSVLGDVGDSFYFIWEIGWLRSTLLGGGLPSLVATGINFPEGWYLTSTDISPGMLLLALPGALLWGPAAGYNSAALLSYLIGGLTMFAWIREETDDAWAGILAGTIYVAAPFRTAHLLAGHLNILGTQWLPLCLAGVIAYLRGRSPLVRGLALAALGYFLTALSSMYFAYMTLVVVAVFALLVVLLSGKGRRREVLRRGAVLGGVLLGTAGVAAIPYLVTPRSMVPVRDFAAAVRGSASPVDFVIPPTFHWLWGKWVGSLVSRPNWIEGTLYVGVAVAALAGFAIFVRPGFGKIWQRLPAALALSAAGSLILALGVVLRWGSRTVMLPWSLGVPSLDTPEGTPVLLPGYLLWRLLPGYSSMRVLTRYDVLVILFLAALAGVGLALLRQRLSGAGRGAAAALAIGLVIVEFLPRPAPITRVEGRPVDTWLAAQPGSGAVVQLPYEENADSQAQIYYTLIHKKPLVGGLYGSFITRQHNTLREPLGSFPSAGSAQQLRDLGVGYVMVDVAWYEARDLMDDVQVLAAAQGWSTGPVLDGVAVFLSRPSESGK